MPTDCIAEGRADLDAWLVDQPDDLYAADPALRALAEHHGLDAARLSRAGRLAAGPIDRAVREAERFGREPVLDAWDAIGHPVEAILHHPAWTEAGRHIQETGQLALYGEDPVRFRLALALFYLTAQVGEGGHHCAIACTAGAIRAIRALGTPEQRARWLGPLLETSFDRATTAAQFLTEVQGGSDVGANGCRAVPEDPARTGPGSRWRLSGEKWFCSNVDAGVFLVTARAGDAPGTRGLGLFLVPRTRDDGRPNGFRIRRLKDKIGTRGLATAEVDFAGAEAEALGPVERGFRHVMEYVIDTSRLYNSFGAAAHARRAYLVARTFARRRAAFGRRIQDFAAVRETLAAMRADAVGCLAAALWVAEALERVESGAATEDERAFFRVSVNLAKTWTALRAREVVLGGIETLAGNGTIETFSPLPRLLRDSIVYENWEGTHNVLRAQVLRDFERLGLHEGWFRVLSARLGPRWSAALSRERAEVDSVLAEPDEALRDLRFRRLAYRLAAWIAVGALEPVDALRPEQEMLLRHVGQERLDGAWLQLLDRLVD